MSVSAKFIADFSSFHAAVDKAETKLTEFRTASGKVESALSRMADSFSGKRILSEATLAVKAVEDLGGVSKLTASEQSRLNSIVNEAISKYRALGQEAPAKMIELEKATRQTEVATGGLSTKMVALGSAIGTSLGTLATNALQSVAASLKQAAVDGQKFSQLSVGFEALTKSIGETKDTMLSTTRTATKGLISDLDLMQSTNKAILLGLPVTAKEMGDLAQTAVTLGRAMGQDATKSLDDLITALGRSSPLILDNLGLTVKLGEANQDYARHLGKSVDELTEAEKKTAFYNAAMTAAARKTDDLGDVHLTASDQVNRLTVALSNLITRIAASANENGQFVSFLGRLASGAERAAGNVTTLMEASRRLNQSLASLVTSPTGGFKLFDATATIEFEKALESVKSPLQDIQPQILGAANITRDWTKTQESLVRETDKLAETLSKKLKPALLTTSEEMKDMAFGAGKLLSGLPEQISSLDSSLRSDFIPAVRLSNDAIMAFAEQGQDSITEVIKTINSQNLTGGIANTRSEFEQLFGRLDGGFSDINDSFQLLAQVSGDTWGGVVQDIASVTAALELAEKAVEAFNNGDRLAGSIAGVAAIDSATGSGSRGKRVAGGAATGASVGSLFGPIGTAIGAGVGALIGVFRGPSQAEKVEELRKAFIAAAGGIEELDRKAMAAGVTLDKMLQAKKVKDYEFAVGDLQQKFIEMEADQQRLNDAIQKYGFSIEELGPALQRQELDSQAKELIEDWRVLVAAGVDLTAVNERMAETMNDYLQMALRTGQEVPAAMRPILESMAKQGTLVDENGEAITDLEKSGIRFSETMTMGFDRVVKKLDELIGRLAGTGQAIASIPNRVIDIEERVRRTEIWEPSQEARIEEMPQIESAQLEGFARGTGGRYLNFGSGTPVALHGRERVMTEAEGQAEAGGWADVAAEVAGLRRDFVQLLPSMMESAARHGAQTAGVRR